jgi:hypothetical protein
LVYKNLVYKNLDKIFQWCILKPTFSIKQKGQTVGDLPIFSSLSLGSDLSGEKVGKKSKYLAFQTGRPGIFWEFKLQEVFVDY